MPDASPFGFLNIDKPLHLTSHDVVSRVRRAFNIRRVGHAGTLDPLATGVLVVCVGTATRLSEYAMSSTKAYRATIQLGASTTTYDAEGDFTEQHDASGVTQADVEAILPQFTGEIQQLPPMYSAVKQDGKKLYELARQGVEVERKPRHVEINSLSIDSYDAQHHSFTLDVICGSGTYIRSLAYDIGQALGVGGYLIGLIRTRSGPFNVADSVPLQTIMDATEPAQYLSPVRDALKSYPSITLDAEALDHVQHGRPFDRTDDAQPDDIALAYSENGEFIAVLRATDSHWKPHKVFSTAS